jgi:excisionase family DNA binding protein
MSETIDGLLGYVTTKTAARLLGITPNAVVQRIKRHRIPTLRVGSVLLVRLSDIKLYE